MGEFFGFLLFVAWLLFLWQVFYVGFYDFLVINERCSVPEAQKSAEKHLGISWIISTLVYVM